MKEITAAYLRTLDDTDCSNVIVSRQIRRFVKKSPSFKEMPMICYIHGAKFDLFKLNGDKFIWSGFTYDKSHKPITVTSDDECLNKDELNKLIVSTFQTMCDLNNCEDIVDTPEDLLEYAEMKLREMLNDESNTESAS